MPRLALSQVIRACALATPLLASLPGPLAAQPMEGCPPSRDIMARFDDFLRTGKMPPELGRWIVDARMQAIEPWKAFDNVHFVGVCWVSAWAVRTDDGVVLIDTLHEPHVDGLVANLGKAGIALADIKYVIMTHGHFDHVGGAAKLKPLLPNAKFVMTQAGWDEALETARASEATPRRWSMIAPEVTVKDGDAIRLGGTSFTVLETPGHTLGTASYVFDVKDANNTYRAVTIGGFGLNAVKDSKQVEAYIASVDRVGALVKQGQAPITVHLAMHPPTIGLMETREKLAARKPGEPNALVDPDDLTKWLAELRTGAEQRLEIERKAGR